MNSIETIEAMIAGLTSTEIKAIMSKVKTNTIKKVDTSRRMKRMAITDLYFKCAPIPETNFEEYKIHAEGIRHQVLSGVDL
jgi:hypothetical protein|tara:strand:- start:146 stop:388 length:243 start_codon:yes stop_codon:yes gene_type:complete